MYRGEIPGFYWDSAKNKYFKVQANHIAPPNSQYAQSNVNREHRETKRRKTREKHIRLLSKQTITRAPLLCQSLLGGSGLLREHSGQPHSAYESQRESALVQGLQCDQISAHDPGHLQHRITDAHYIPETSQWLLASSHSAGSHGFYICDQRLGMHKPKRLSRNKGLHAFHAPISHVSCADVNGTRLAIACTAEPSLITGNLFVTDISSLDNEGATHTSYTVNIGDSSKPDRLWDCKVNHKTNEIAFAGSAGFEVYNLEHRRVSSRLVDENSYRAGACEWLDSQTLAAGMLYENRDRPRPTYWSEVYLWDLRSEGISSRIFRKERINGLHNPSMNGNSLLVGSARGIALHDLRMLGDAPNLDDQNAMAKLRHQPEVLFIPHISQNPRLDLTTYNGSCVAAVDYENRLQVYSLRTGKRLRTLGLPHGTTGLMSRPKWQEDERGSPYLQVCAGETIQQWSWNGLDEE